MSSNSAYQSAKNASLSWNPALLSEIGEIQGQLNNPEVEKAIIKQSLAKFNKVVRGIDLFHKSKYVRKEIERPVIFKKGSTKIVRFSTDDYAENNSENILFIPSLINRSYIFDLSEKHSMASYFAQNHNSFLLDWGEPSAEEAGFSAQDYIAKRLNVAIDHIYNITKKPVILVGYCMGGLFSIASALSNRDKVRAIALLATPWDFKSADIKKSASVNFNIKNFTSKSFVEYLKDNEIVSGAFVHQLLYFLRPWAVQDKYEKFSEMEIGSKEAQSFIEREYWLHDNVALTSKVAKECFIDWAVNNDIINGRWLFEGKKIDPTKLDVTSFIAIARHDKIVPPLCVSPLSALISGSTTIYPQTGHIGLVAGINAQENLWLPLENWIRAL